MTIDWYVTKEWSPNWRFVSFWPLPALELRMLPRQSAGRWRAQATISWLLWQGWVGFTGRAKGLTAHDVHLWTQDGIDAFTCVCGEPAEHAVHLRPHCRIALVGGLGSTTDVVDNNDGLRRMASCVWRVTAHGVVVQDDRFPGTVFVDLTDAPYCEAAVRIAVEEHCADVDVVYLDGVRL